MAADDAEMERANQVAQDAAAVLDRTDEAVEHVDWSIPQISALADVAVDLSNQLQEKLVVLRHLLEMQQQEKSSG